MVLLMKCAIRLSVLYGSKPSKTTLWSFNGKTIRRCQSLMHDLYAYGVVVWSCFESKSLDIIVQTSGT